jgi:hypothetical protein
LNDNGGDSARVRVVAHAILRASYPNMSAERFTASWKISTDEWRWQFLHHARAALEALDSHDATRPGGRT